jgi:hypothetical protein
MVAAAVTGTEGMFSRVWLPINMREMILAGTLQASWGANISLFPVTSQQCREGLSLERTGVATCTPQYAVHHAGS